MDNDIRAQYYGIKRFNQMVYNLQNAMLRHMPSVVKYLKNTKKLRAIASGFTNNIGHQVINELNGLDLVAKEPAAECIFLWGDQDKFDSPKLFPELPWHGYEAGNIVPLPAQGGNESKRFSPETLFKAAMHHSLTVMRVGSSSPFGNSLGRRVVEFARKLKSPGLEEQMHAASLCWPMVMITLRGHTRCWVSELQGVPQVVLALKEQYPGLGVLYDGAPVEKPREEAIRKVVGTEIPQFSTIGGSLYDTICWAARIDFFISPHGAGSIFTSIANKPGVLHSHENWYLADLPYANPREDYAKSTFVLGKIVSPTNNVFTEQYELDWKVLVEKSFNIISELPSPDGK